MDLDKACNVGRILERLGRGRVRYVVIVGGWGGTDGRPGRRRVVERSREKEKREKRETSAESEGGAGGLPPSRVTRTKRLPGC